MSVLVALCALRIEIDDEEMAQRGGNSTSTKDNGKQQPRRRDRGARESKTITVETYASKLSGNQADWALLPTSSRETTPNIENTSGHNTKSAQAMEEIGFFCGNPLIEVTKGILHLYKENSLCDPEVASEAKMLCLMAVPAALGARDLLAFAAACQRDIAHVRVLRDGSPSHYMALLTFRSSTAARDFYSAFDGAAYSSLEPGALCHMAWVSRVEWGRADAPPPPHHTELPTCAVCLERMDESVAGVLSVQCAHAFHTDCLLGWGDASCPVCRCAQTPEPMANAECFDCAKLQNNNSEAAQPRDDGKALNNSGGLAEGLGMESMDPGTLWICLICGNVGCGRYEGGHAAMHFRASNHTYALQLGSNRVWDYAGDNFVHRLVQNKSDGKLVAAGGGLTDDEDCPALPSEKLDSAQLEFTYLLTQQLERQRHFYEEKISKLESNAKLEADAMNERAEKAEDEAKQLKERVSVLTKENRSLEKKLQSVTARVTVLQSEVSEERGLATALSENQKAWQAAAQAKESDLQQQITELREQLRDVMFFVEARDKIESEASMEELKDGTASVPEKSGSKSRRKKR